MLSVLTQLYPCFSQGIHHGGYGVALFVSRGFGSPETHPKVILFPTADLWTYFSPFAWQNSPARATAASIAVWPEDELKTPDEATRLSPTP